MPKHLPPEILFASTNAGKLAEVREVCVAHGIVVISPEDLRIRRGLTPPPEVDESGACYEQNARLKAEALFAWGGAPTLADDSGLEVEALEGRPGLHTARYAGPHADAAQNRAKLLREMGSAGNRAARFVCCLCFIREDGASVEVRAELAGSIAREEHGEGGFGYDPVFIPEGRKATLAALKGAGDGIPTHRVLALRKFFAALGGD